LIIEEQNKQHLVNAKSNFYFFNIKYKELFVSADYI